jgi:rod shape determining protein RodA
VSLRGGRGAGYEIPRSPVGVTRWQRFRASVDVTLVLTVAAIVAVGLLNLYSATHGTRHAGKFDQQVTWVIGGTMVFVVATAIDYRTLIRWAWLGLAGVISMLLIVRLLGQDAHANGSYRWFNVGAIGGQPSELAKVAVILVLAKIFHESDLHRLRWPDIAWRVAIVLVPVLLIAAQPDLGTSILLALVILTIGFLCMVELWPMVYVTFAGLTVVPIIWELQMHWYQKQRVLAFLDPDADPTGAGWHTRQSIFAVGSGEVTGKGFMEGTQNRFEFLPEHWTDFPFSVWAEEWGFLGSLALLSLFVFLLVWIINVAVNARDRAGTVICIGVAAMTFWHVLVNVAMVLGMAPVVGVTLPFISYGGSSLLTFFFAMGLVASVSLRKHGY